VNVQLTAEEARVIGCLMEKSVTTPEQYPLTLNALSNACNQKSSREPVMSLEPGRVQQTVRQLEAKHLMQVADNFNSRVEKYDHRFCNTPFADLQFSSEEFAVVCVLLLRGPQTPGELRSRCNRLFAFADNEAVVSTLAGLLERAEGSVVARLPRAQGRQDHEYLHLFCGEVASVAEVSVSEAAKTEDAANRSPTVSRAAPLDDDRLDALEQRILQLETQLGELKALLD
jgi:uncharacterized protein YceH (UPF0502 family)